MTVLMNIFLYVLMLAPVPLCFYWYKSQLENQIIEIRSTLSDLQSQINKEADIKDTELMHQTDKVIGNHDQETQSSQSDVKSQDKKPDMKPKDNSTNTMQCNNSDNKKGNDDQKNSNTTDTWWSLIKNIGIQSYGVLTVFNHLFIGGFILLGVLRKIIN